MARSHSQSFRLRKGCLKLLFFALTFIVFVALQNLLHYAEPAWQAIQRELIGIPWWILALACLGTIPIVWIIVLGVDQLLERLCNKRQSSYESLSSDEDSDDVETGAVYQRKYTKEPKRKRDKNTHDKKASQNRSTTQGSQGGDGEESSGENPTDVDVTVHPVDTTIAAGGEARISPSYNVSLMNFTTEAPSSSPYEEGNRLYPSAPLMQGGPAFLKRQF